MRGRQPGASARLCPAGAALWRAVDTLPARGGAAAYFFWRDPKAERGCERRCVCVARAGSCASLGSELSPQPPEGTHSVRSAPGGQRPVTPALGAAFVARARESERAGLREAAARRGARGTVSPSLRAAEGVARARGRRGGRRGADGGGWRELSWGKLRASSGGWAFAQGPWAAFLHTKCHLVTSARACLPALSPILL